MELQDLLNQPSKLPTIPKVAQQLIASFSSEDVSVNDIARQLATDPALSAKLLRLANSAYFHLSRTIGTVDDALRMLGFVMVRNLVLGNSMAAAFRHAKGIDLHQFWRYNLYTACAARWLASQDGVNADLVFTVGLVHGVGQLHMHAAAPEAMVALDKKCHVLDSARALAERSSLGFHHGDVAAALARIWNFPEPITVALQGVPLPLAAEPSSEAAAWVHMGAWRARTEVLNLTPAQALASYPAEVAQRLRLEPEWAMPTLQDLTEGMEAMLD